MCWWSFPPHNIPLIPRLAMTPKRSSSRPGARARRVRTTRAVCHAPKTGAASSTPSATFCKAHGPDCRLQFNPITSVKPTMSQQLVESRLDPAQAAIDEVHPAGEPWMKALQRGQILRIVDLEGNQAVDTIFYSAADPQERYSLTHTIQAQGALYLGTGSQLMSSEGRPMLTIVADTCGRHDTLGGACASESNTVRYALEKRFMHNCRDNYLLAVAHAPQELDKRDVVSNINFFMNVPVTP